MSCEHVSRELKHKTIVKLISSAYSIQNGRLFQTVWRSMRTDEKQCFKGALALFVLVSFKAATHTSELASNPGHEPKKVAN